jgi:hypothetical protein
LEFPKILESAPSNVVGTAQIRLNRRTGGQLMLRGRVMMGNLSSSESSRSIEDHQPHLQWTLQLPGIYYFLFIKYMVYKLYSIIVIYIYT